MALPPLYLITLLSTRKPKCVAMGARDNFPHKSQSILGTVMGTTRNFIWARALVVDFIHRQFAHKRYVSEFVVAYPIALTSGWSFGLNIVKTAF